MQRIGKRFLNSALLIVPLVLVLGAQQAAAQNWQLIWSDEFNGAAGSFPDATKWKYDVGGGGWGNSELETYCAAGSIVSPCSTASPNAYLDGNGNLVIKAINTNGTWTSARMLTAGKFQFTYGRVEARMKLTVGNGLWPAFWMLGSSINNGVSWPTCGEDDIMEWVDTYGPSATSSTTHGPGYSGAGGIGARYTFPNGGRIDDPGYHIYGLIWSQNLLQYYRDDPSNIFLTITPASIPAGTQWVYNNPFFILLNFAVGGNWFAGPDATTPNPATMLVDYVRVYQVQSGSTAPAAPSHLVGTAASSTEVDLSWTASTTTGVTYNVLRNGTAVTTNLTRTTYADTGLTPSTAYTYTVQAVDAGGSAASTPVTVTTPSGVCTSNCPADLIAINSGGAATGAFSVDKYFTGGGESSSGATVSTAGVANAAPEAVYQSQHLSNVTYTLPGLTPGTSYPVRLHFAETYWTTAGSRLFNVSINGTQVLTNFDIFQSAGGTNKALVEQFNAIANAAGQIVLQFTTVKDQAAVNGIEVLSAGGTTSAQEVDINAGGGVEGTYAADKDFVGGTTAATTATINTAGVTNPPPAAVYQSERFGAFTYTVPNLTPGGSYTVDLHFAEIYWTAAGKRQFNVLINGIQVLTNFDIFNAAGGENKAIVKSFAAIASSSGATTIQFTAGAADQPKISAIQITHP